MHNAACRVVVFALNPMLPLLLLLSCNAQANVITTDAVPTHLARMNNEEAADPESAISTYVDLALLARARCAIYSNSGYSMTAWMMGGGTSCYEHLEWGLGRCLSEAAGSFSRR
jgi:hypothetical protein